MRIITGLTPNYSSALKLFIPSWLRYADASEIHIHRLGGTTWKDSIIEKQCLILKAIQTGYREGLSRLVWLDCDVLVRKSLNQAFDLMGDAVIGCVRPDNVNFGVLFFDLTKVGKDFILRWEETTHAVIDGLRANHRDEQAIWTTFLHSESVCWLGEQWNFCPNQPDEWLEGIDRLGDAMAILHVKGKGGWDEPRHRAKLDVALKRYPELK